MKIQPYFDKLNQAQSYQTFVKDNPDAFMVAGFFVLDLETQKNIHQLDFYVPSKKKIAAFTLDGDVACQMLDAMHDKAPGKIEPKADTDLDELQGILEDEMKNRNMSEKIQKIIAILQDLDGKKVWNVSAVLSGLHILRSHLEDSSKTILKMEKASMMDFVKQVDPAQLQAQQGQQPPTMPQPPQLQQQAQPQQPPTMPQQPQQPQSPEEKEKLIKDEVEKLDKLEKAIEDEKQALKKELDKKEEKKD